MNLMHSDSFRTPIKRGLSESNLKSLGTSDSIDSWLSAPASARAPQVNTVHPKPTGSAVKSNIHDTYDFNSVDAQHMDIEGLPSPFHVPSLSFDYSVADSSETEYYPLLHSHSFPRTYQQQQEVDLAASTFTPFLFNEVSAYGETTMRSWNDELPVKSFSYSDIPDDLLKSPAESSASSIRRDREERNPSFIANVSLEDIMNQLVLSRVGSPVSFDKRSASSLSKASVDTLGCNF